MLEALLSTSKGAGLTPGTPYLGGFYVGELLVNGTKYSLIVAPKALGETTGLVYDTAPAGNKEAQSTWDGAGNTATLVAHGTTRCQAALFCHNLSIGGFTDWVLPAQDQLEMLYRAFKPTATVNQVVTGQGVNTSSNPNGAAYTLTSPPQTNVAIFQAGGSEAFQFGTASSPDYWSSTGSPTALSYADTQAFYSGRVGASAKSASSGVGGTLWVRAVRMVAHT
jgi:hypothetical protein